MDCDIVMMLRLQNERMTRFISCPQKESTMNFMD